MKSFIGPAVATLFFLWNVQGDLSPRAESAESFGLYAYGTGIGGLALFSTGGRYFPITHKSLHLTRNSQQQIYLWATTKLQTILKLLLS
jgi:hypothetical protein